MTDGERAQGHPAPVVLPRVARLRRPGWQEQAAIDQGRSRYIGRLLAAAGMERLVSRPSDEDILCAYEIIRSMSVIAAAQTRRNDE